MDPEAVHVGSGKTTISKTDVPLAFLLKSMVDAVRRWRWFLGGSEQLNLEY